MRAIPAAETSCVITGHLPELLQQLTHLFKLHGEAAKHFHTASLQQLLVAASHQEARLPYMINCADVMILQ